MSIKFNNQFAVVIVVSFFCYCESIYPQSFTNCVPGWDGTVLVDCETTSNWSIEASLGSSGFISATTGVIGNAVNFNWDFGTGDWVQAKYTFAQPVDLSQMDIFGLSLQGNGSYPNDIDLMFADINNVFYGAHFENLNRVRTWMKNLALPKKLFYWYFQTKSEPIYIDIDWSQINRFFVVVKRPIGANLQYSAGQLGIDHLQTDRAADWIRQQQFEFITDRDTIARNNAVSYILSQQLPTGLIVSWKEEPAPKAWLYDEALALIVLSREGLWLNGIAQNQAAISAKALINFITSKQKPDGHWPRAWNPESGTELVDDQWVGDQAWWVIAASQYIAKSQDMMISNSVERGADWLALKIGINGALVPSTEGNVDAWWAMISTKRFVDANKIQLYLLNKVWDTELKYWWRGLNNDSIPDPFVAMDCATWVSEFAKSSHVQLPVLSLAAISFVHRTLMTTDSSGFFCGLDGMGPISVWCEGTAQYIVAGGENSQEFLNMLLSLQRSDGGMPGSPDNIESNTFGWLTNWTGLSSTAWLYFALTASPFPNDSTTDIKINTQQSQDFELKQNYPNPFNTSSVIKYSIPRLSHVIIKVFNTLGKELLTLVDEEKPGGTYEVNWNGVKIPSGVYFYRLQAGDFIQTRKMILLK